LLTDTNRPIFTSGTEANQYIWSLSDWPNFRWDDARLIAPLGIAHRKEGRLLGRMARLGFDLKLAAEVDAITEEAHKSLEIEGGVLNRDSVRSSVARRLGVPDAALAPEDRKVEGIVEITLDATKKFAEPLTRERLLGWHAGLFPIGYSGLRIKVGAWRDGPRNGSRRKWRGFSLGSKNRGGSTGLFMWPSPFSGS
jgi:Fic family protein